MPTNPDEIRIKDNVMWLIAGAFLLLLAGSFSLGVVWQSMEPCDHQTIEVPTTGGGIMLLVPKDWNVFPVLNGFSRPYMRPTDELG